MNNISQKGLLDHLLNYWPIFASGVLIIMALTGHSLTMAMDVNTNIGDIEDLTADFKELSEVKVDINTLEKSNVSLKKDVEHIRESQKRSENQIQETNLLIKSLIIESKAKKVQEKLEPRVIYMMPEEQYRPYNQQQQQQQQQQQYRRSLW